MLSRYLETCSIKDGNTNKHILYSTQSGKILAISDDIYSILSKGEQEKVPSAVFAELKKYKMLSSQSKYGELKNVLDENNDPLNHSDLYTVVQPTAYCPLGCNYCGQSHKMDRLKETDQDKLVEGIKARFKPHHKSITVCWFGAEPLSNLKSIEQLSEKLMEFAAAKSVPYNATIVTNGLLLKDKVIEKLFDMRVNKIEITLDGSSAFHDKRRFKKDGSPTFTTIYNNLLNLIRKNEGRKNPARIVVRCNVDKKNLEGVSPLLKTLAKDNIHNKISFYLAPIHSWGNDADKDAAEKQIFADEEINWFCEMMELGFQLSLFPSRRKITCLATNKSGELVDPYGSTFKCTEVSLVPTYEKDGKNIHRTGQISSSQRSTSIYESFNKHIEENKVPCHSCKFLPVCGGFCPKEWMEGRAACPSFKFNMQQRLLLQYLKEKKVKSEAG